MMNTSGNQIVAIGMSGGIDSTIAAYVLKEKGFTVVGLTMKIWDDSIRCETSRSGCYGPNEASDIADAKQAADMLGIKHVVLDLREEYQQTVINYFRREYANGRTPNPCVMCNSRIKFGTLLDRAQSSGITFEFFATGHYARVTYDERLMRYLLMRGVDEAKDQSYFLHRLTQEQLQKIVFPLGDYRKDEVKMMALDLGFGYYMDKPESQDFIEWDNYGTLLEKPARPGNIRDLDGNIIGTHRGIEFYTVGQRRMLNLAGMKEPFYVIRIETERNEIIAGPKRYLMSSSLVATDLHWIVPLEEYSLVQLRAKIRSTAAPAECIVSPLAENKAWVQFVVPQESITPGQSVVFYAEDVVLGGGVIER